ncbi:MAG TPA: tRNA epoxyqueuosine(34) reductase QueG [Opitutaceae bacterium]|nr:tRNA epoxyqueuosine(34) reductase QueG [Opitutaceae bacterium]
MSAPAAGAREDLRAALRDAGFDVVRFARAEPEPGETLARWIAAGHHADMDWMASTSAKRADPALVLERARTFIVLGVSYWPEDSAAARQTAWARYALHADYHDTIKAGLVRAGKILEARFGLNGTDYRYYVDTGPVAERGWAARSGVGFLGKNGMLISREHGNWLFLSVILARIEIEPDASLAEAFPGAAERAGANGLLCGSCTRCMEACPTAAFPEPGIVDARRCISYHTIENRGIIPPEIRAGIGTRVFGCDICLDACPWNRFARAGRSLLLERRPEIARLTLVELLSLTPERFREVFRGTAVKRLKLPNLLRNAAIVAGNVWALDPASRAEASEGFADHGDRDSGVRALARLATHESPVVRAHAVWALRRILGQEADDVLAVARALETDPVVLAEYGVGGG